MDSSFSNLLLRNSYEGPDKNSCFTNAAIQVLRNVPEIRDNINENPYHSEIQNDLKKIIDGEKTNKTFSTARLRENVGRTCRKQEYLTGQQCDSLEFLEDLVESTHPDIKSLFQFKVNRERKFGINDQESGCQICGVDPSNSEQNDMVLKLEFPILQHLYESGISLQHLVNEHFEEKFTDQDNGLRCSNCCKHETT